MLAPTRDDKDCGRSVAAMPTAPTAAAGGSGASLAGAAVGHSLASQLCTDASRADGLWSQGRASAHHDARWQTASGATHDVHSGRRARSRALASRVGAGSRGRRGRGRRGRVGAGVRGRARVGIGVRSVWIPFVGIGDETQAHEILALLHVWRRPYGLIEEERRLRNGISVKRYRHA